MFYMIRHAAGFLLQFVPCIILFQLPFSKRDYRLPWKNFILFCIVFFTVVVMGFACLISFLYQRQDFSAIYMCANVYMTSSSLLAAAVFFSVIRQPWWKKNMAFCVSITYGIASWMTVNMILHVIPAEYLRVREGDVYEPVVVFLYAGVTIVLFPLMAVFMRRIMKGYFVETEEGIQKKGAIMLFSFTILYFLVISFGSYSPSDLCFDIRFPILVLLFCFATFCVGVIYFFLFWEIRQVRKKGQLEKLLELQKIQYQNIQSDIENTRKIRHDLRQQYRMVSKLLNDNKLEEVKAFLKSGDAKLKQQEQFCKEPAVNALLQYYAGIARKKQIEYRVKARINELHMDNLDVVVFLGNMLENAVLSCENAGEHAFIKLTIGMVQKNLVISMENSCEKVLFSRGKIIGRWMGAEAIRSLRGGGIGLKSMEQTAKRYGGNVEFKFQEQVFYTRAFLCTEDEIST